MLNSLVANRRLARRLLWVQSGVVVLAGLIFLLQGPLAGLAAAAGALLVVLGNTLFAARALTGMGAGMAVTRFVAGLLLKWVVVLGGMYIVLVAWNLPPVPMMAGLAMALLVQLFALRFKLNS